MADDASAALERALGSPPPAALIDALDSEDARHLAGVIERSRREQAEALDDAIEGAFRHLPWPLRGTVRRALGA